MKLRRGTLAVLVVAVLGTSQPALAFDLEDFATTYRATRDAFLKSQNEEVLAKSALDYWAGIAAAYGIDAHPESVQAPASLLSGACTTAAPTLGDLGGAFEDFILYAAPYLTPEALGAVRTSLGWDAFNGPLIQWLQNTVTTRLNSLPHPTIVPNAAPACGPTAGYGYVPGEGFASLEELRTRVASAWDAYVKAANELAQATSPYLAARDAYVIATQVYTDSILAPVLDGPALHLPPYTLPQSPALPF